MKRIHNHKIDLVQLIIRLLLCCVYTLPLVVHQIFWNEFHDSIIATYTELDRFVSYFQLIMLIIAYLFALSTLAPIIKYIFLRKTKKYIGTIKDVKCKSVGILQVKHFLTVIVEYEQRKYISEKIFIYLWNDEKYNFGDIADLIKDKKVFFYTSLLNKEKIFVSKIKI